MTSLVEEMDAHENELPSCSVPREEEKIPIDLAIVNQLQEVFTTATDWYKSNPTAMGPAIVAFCSKAKNMSCSSFITALHCFGKYSGAGTAAHSRLAGSRTIGVQPTALARRKMVVGGRRRSYLGRPPRSSFAGEHDYARKICHRHRMPKRRVPHKLQLAVDNVESHQ